jgi:hypothetical protein
MLIDPMAPTTPAGTPRITDEQAAELKKTDEEIRKSLLAQLSTKKKIEESEKQINALIAKGKTLKEGSFEFETNIRDLDKEIIENENLKTQLAKEEADNKERSAAKQAVQDRKTDELGGTVADWAAGGFNRNPWHNYQVRTARQVQALEAGAAWRFRQTGDLEGALGMKDYANQMRVTMSGLTSRERYPEKDVQAHLIEANKHLSIISGVFERAKAK